MKTLIALSLAGVALTGCAVYPAVDAGVYVAPPPAAVVVRPYYGPPPPPRHYYGHPHWRRW